MRKKNRSVSRIVEEYLQNIAMNGESLTVAMAREPFFDAGKTVLAMAETNRIIGTTSANCIANIYITLRASLAAMKKPDDSSLL